MRWYLISFTVPLLLALNCSSRVNSTSLSNHDGGFQDVKSIDQEYNLPNLKDNQEVKIIIKEIKGYSGQTPKRFDQDDFILFKDYHFQKRAKEDQVEPSTPTTGSSLGLVSTPPTSPTSLSSRSRSISPKRPIRSFGADLRDTPHRPEFQISSRLPREAESPRNRGHDHPTYPFLDFYVEPSSPKTSTSSITPPSSPKISPSSPIKHVRKGGNTSGKPNLHIKVK